MTKDKATTRPSVTSPRIRACPKSAASAHALRTVSRLSKCGPPKEATWARPVVTQTCPSKAQGNPVRISERNTSAPTSIRPNIARLRGDSRDATHPASAQKSPAPAAIRNSAKGAIQP